MSAFVTVCKHDKTYPCEFCLEERIADLERQLVETQGKIEAAEKAARTYRLMANTPASRKLADELAHILKEGNE